MRDFLGKYPFIMSLYVFVSEKGIRRPLANAFSTDSDYQIITALHGQAPIYYTYYIINELIEPYIQCTFA